jgi:KaiC/GvpD/RAD55 family RecA-like ATPase
MNPAKEKLIIENLFSSTDVFARCIDIVNAKYFSPEFRPCVSFLKDYYDKYNSIPTAEAIKAETNTDLTKREITRDIFNYTCDTVEEFCKNSALKIAIKEFLPEIDKSGSEGILQEKIKEAMSISLQKDLGLQMYGDPEEKLKKFAENEIYYSTGIPPVDDILMGGLARGTLTLVSANSGGGKSVMLANIGKYMSEAGLKVLYISLELKQEMIYLRIASMISKVSTRVWKQEISTIAHEINKLEEEEAGGLLIKRLPSGTSANGIRSFLKLYELEFKELPDVLIVDYLDPMHPNEGIKNLSISEQDKLKSEQLVEILEDYNMIGLSASQQNREAIKNASPDQSIIAGGLSKINAVHNYISIFMDPIMRLNGEMLLYFLKTRTSMGHGQCIHVSFNPNNLIISSSHVKNVPLVIEPQAKGKNKTKQKGQSKAEEIMAAMKNNINSMPEEIKQEFVAINQDSKITIETEDGDKQEIDLLSLIHTI